MKINKIIMIKELFERAFVSIVSYISRYLSCDTNKSIERRLRMSTQPNPEHIVLRGSGAFYRACKAMLESSDISYTFEEVGESLSMNVFPDNPLEKININSPYGCIYFIGKVTCRIPGEPLFAAHIMEKVFDIVSLEALAPLTYAEANKCSGYLLDSDSPSVLDFIVFSMLQELSFENIGDSKFTCLMSRYFESNNVPIDGDIVEIDDRETLRKRLMGTEN